MDFPDGCCYLSVCAADGFGSVGIAVASGWEAYEPYRDDHLFPLHAA